MADREPAQPDDAPIRPDELRRRLADAASVIDVGDSDGARARLDVIVGRRRNRKRAGAALGAAALILGAASTAVLMFGDDGPDRLATSDRTDAPTINPDDSVDAAQSTIDRPSADRAVITIDGASRVASTAGAGGAPEWGEWIVPWEDGFLVGSTSFPPQPLPDTLPDDVIALFPQEVIDVFGGELPATIAEATDRLSEAGLLDEASDVIASNPAAYDAIYGAPSEPPTFDVRFTADGTTWEPREMARPPGASYLESVTAVGGRLAAVYSMFDPTTGAPVDGTVIVATTGDLTTWTTQEIVPSAGDMPEGFNRTVYAHGFVANDNGWLLNVSDTVDIDPLVLLPADVRAEIDAGNGFATSSDDRGLTVEYDFDGDTPGTTRTFSWAELGVTPDAQRLLTGQDYSPTLWAATWDGDPSPVADAPIGGAVAATPAGFVRWSDQIWFSPDGITWTASPLPDAAGWVTGVFAIDGGLIVLSSTPGGESLVYRVDDRGGNAVALDVPLPEVGLYVSSPPTSGSSVSGMIVAAEPTTDAGLSVEHGGYRLTMSRPSLLEVIDVATGDVVARGMPTPSGSAEGSPITFDDAGVTVTDPATGEVLVVFPTDLLNAADSEQTASDDTGDSYPTDFWLVASLDGERFVVDDLGDRADGVSAMASNGTRLLIQSGTDWILYDLS